MTRLTAVRNGICLAAVYALTTTLSVGPAQAQTPSGLTAEETAFLKTVRRARVADVQKALDEGAVPTPWALYTAIGLYRTDVLELLIDHGADVNGRIKSDDAGGIDFTPLFGAALAGRADMVTLLLDAGADPQAKCRFLSMDMTPLDAAVMDKKTDVIEILTSAGARLDTAPGGSVAADLGLMEAIQDGDIDALRSMIAAGADVNARYNIGMTPLSHAAGYPKRDLASLEEIVEFLIESGADVNARNEDGSTAFMHAARRGAPAIMRKLLDEGADPDARDEAGYHAIFYADGYDPVSSLIQRTSSELRSYDSVPEVRDGGTYPPGTYRCPCEKSGAPPRFGIPTEKSGLQKQISTRIRGPRGFKASAAAPECAPVELTEPGQYSGYMISCSETWSVSEHQLRQTTGEVTKLAYIHRDPECVDSVFLFSIDPAAPEERPDRCRNARLEVLLPTSQDQFSFDDGDPGRVEIPLQARVEPEDCADELLWEAPDIEGTEKSMVNYDGAAAGQGDDIVRLVYEKLPESNDDFGRITVRASMNEQIRDVEVQLFFDPLATNHPGEDAGETPNWFYYWAQTSAYSRGNISGIEPTYTETITPCSGGNQIVQGRYSYHDDALLLSDGIMTKPCVAPAGGTGAKGIDCYAEILRHEGTHRLELRSWWPIEVETAVGPTVSLGPTGCQTWTGAASAALARYQDWLFGLLGEEERALYHGVDTDLDMVPDRIETALSARGCDKDNPVSCQGRPYGLDVELNAYTEQWKWPRSSADDEDWSRCGKQWKKGGC